MQSLNIDTLSRALKLANAAYLSRKGINDASIMQDDIATALKWANPATIAHVATLMTQEQQNQFLNDVAYRLPVKACKRVIEFFNAIAMGDISKLDGVTALETLSAHFAGAQTRSAVFFAATGKGNESTSDEVKRIALVRKLQKVLPMVAAGTESTQNSRSFGKNGFALVLGFAFMQKRKGAQSVMVVNPENAFFTAMCDLVHKTSESDMRFIKGAKKNAQ